MRHVLLATDGSDSSTKACKAAAKLLEAFPELTLTVIHVMHPAYLGAGLGLVTDVGDDTADLMAKEIEQQIRQQFKPWETRTRFVSVYGPPGQCICDYANEEAVDLVIVGSHGRGAVDRLLLGSVSNFVVNHANVPVFVVK